MVRLLYKISIFLITLYLIFINISYFTGKKYILTIIDLFNDIIFRLFYFILIGIISLGYISGGIILAVLLTIIFINTILFDCKKCKILDCISLANNIKQEIKNNISTLPKNSRVPCLATVLVGDNEGSKLYIKSKQKACNEVGILTKNINFPNEVKQDDLIRTIEKLNNDPSVDGIIVQLPLPEHLIEEEVLSAINIYKDVDCLTPTNIALLGMDERNPIFEPCTPKGIIEIMERNNVEIEGKNAVIIVKSNIFGMNMANLLLKKKAIVTICDANTKNIPYFSSKADIVIVAVGKKYLVKKNWIKQNAVVIDVGINKEGKKVYGDVDPSVMEVAGKITPVPHGVGPMTIVMLLVNTLKSFRSSK